MRRRCLAPSHTAHDEFIGLAIPLREFSHPKQRNENLQDGVEAIRDCQTQFGGPAGLYTSEQLDSDDPPIMLADDCLAADFAGAGRLSICFAETDSFERGQ